MSNSCTLSEVGHVTDRFGDAAARFIAQHAEEPFFLFVAFTAPHGPLQPLEEDLARIPAELPEKRRKNLGLLVGLDRSVGKILDALEAHGLTEQSFVLFTNDNGGQTQTGARNAPLRGRKGQLHEGGIRVPMAACWPGHIRPGTVIEEPVIALDLTPTCFSLAGAPTPSEPALDGIDLLPRLRGRAEALAERALFWRTHGSRGPVAVREGRWKLVHERDVESSSPRLFDLAADLGEERDLAVKHPERVADLLAKIAAWEKPLQEPTWRTDGQSR